MKETKLQKLMRLGIVWIEDDIYLGTAFDGVVVQFGIVSSDGGVEDYLEKYPSPKDW